MSEKSHTIEVDEGTWAALNDRAAERGVSISQIVSELVPVALDNEAVAELDRRWKNVELGVATVGHDEVVRWLRTWGSPAFRTWSRG